MENTNSFQVGALVKSNAGRDKDHIYMIYRKVNESHVHLVDGNFRKSIKPKLKKIKHIDSLHIVLEKIKTKLEQNMKVFDSEIYSAMKKALENDKTDS